MNRKQASGFTLIEVLVVIAVISLLVGIALPAFRGARVRSRETLSLSNARRVATTFDAYSSSRRTYPFPGMVDGSFGDVEISVRWYPMGTIVASSSVWSASVLWPGFVSDELPWEEHFETWVSPGLPTALPEGWLGDGGIEPLDLISYEYSHGFLGRPGLWVERAGDAVDPDIERLVAPTRPDMVVFPSQKVMTWDRHLAYRTDEVGVVEGHLDAPTPMAFADTHAEIRVPSEAQAGWINPLNGGDTRRLHNTPRGLGGTDY